MFNIYFKEMKKFFSLIALVGVIAACTPEQVDTAFKLAGAKVTVNVEVVDIINGGAYTGDYTVSSNFGTVSGNTITFQAGDSEAISGADYTVSVSGSKLAKTYSSSFTVPAVLAGGEATIKVVVPVGEPINGWTVDLNWDDFDNFTEEEKVAFLVNTHYPTHAYSHEGVDTWYYNNTEFAVDGTVDFSWHGLFEAEVTEDNNYVGFEGVVENYVDGYMADLDDYYGFEYNLTYKFTVSAWAMWNVTQTVYSEFCPHIGVIAFKDANEDGVCDKTEEKLDLGAFELYYEYANLVDYHELPYPGAPGHAHYHAGHGHDAHGSAANAGGGLAFNE